MNDDILSSSVSSLKDCFCTDQRGETRTRPIQKVKAQPNSLVNLPVLKVCGRTQRRVPVSCCEVNTPNMH